VAENKHHFVEANGIRIHVVERGEGPLVLLCHGFPESWYSWRHQLEALAEAGYRAVAPDMRGYGRTSRPEPIEAYSQLQLAGDMASLLHGLGESSAVIVGHDWGAPVAWTSALLRPDLFPAVVALSVPYFPRTPARPTEVMKAMAGDRFHYILYFQTPGVAERELERDVRHWLEGFFYTASGDVPPERVRLLELKRGAIFGDGFAWPEKLPPWLSEQDLDFYAGEFERTGFRGGLSWYRAIDASWEQTAALTGARVNVPALFIAGERDLVISTRPEVLETLPEFVPRLRGTILLPGCGHWTQQERPDAVNEHLIAFLKEVT
jgi:pimeloyl-ACP methyl ester carboxylesterase